MKSLYLKQWDAFIRYHELAGSGPPLVYLPGMSVPATVKFSFGGDAPSDERHAHAAGGLSRLRVQRPSCEFLITRWKNHARTVAAILDHEGLQACTVVGHSMGGTVGIMLALQRPDLVSRLVVAEGQHRAWRRGVVQLCRHRTRRMRGSTQVTPRSSSR